MVLINQAGRLIDRFRHASRAISHAVHEFTMYLTPAGDKNFLGAAAAMKELKVDVNDFDFRVYWQPTCEKFELPMGVGTINGRRHVLMGAPQKQSLLGPGMHAEWSDKAYVEIVKKTLAHELGHNFGEGEASCMNDNDRGRVAWCDSDRRVHSSRCDLYSLYICTDMDTYRYNHMDGKLER